MSMKVEPKTYYHSIKVKIEHNGDVIKHLYWDNFQLHQVTKWRWYFNYRAALLQVQYPKGIIDHNWGAVPANKKTAKVILRNRMIAQKRKITEYKNKLQKAEDSWNQIFPITDDPMYKKCEEKIEKHQLELSKLKIEIHELNNLDHDHNQ